MDKKKKKKEKKSLGELFEIYSDFWLGVAAAGAQGAADIGKAMQNRSQERRDHLLDLESLAAGVQIVTKQAATSLEAIAKAAREVQVKVKVEEKEEAHK
jgi:hypothetical protein